MDLIYHYGCSECKDPRDRVYGLLSLAMGRRYILQDYSKLILEVYWDIVWFQNVGGQKYYDEDDINSSIFSSLRLQHIAPWFLGSSPSSVEAVPKSFI